MSRSSRTRSSLPIPDTLRIRVRESLGFCIRYLYSDSWDCQQGAHQTTHRQLQSPCRPTFLNIRWWRWRDVCTRSPIPSKRRCSSSRGIRSINSSTIQMSVITLRRCWLGIRCRIGCRCRENGRLICSLTGCSPSTILLFLDAIEPGGEFWFFDCTVVPALEVVVGVCAALSSGVVSPGADGEGFVAARVREFGFMMVVMVISYIFGLPKFGLWHWLAVMV